MVSGTKDSRKIQGLSENLVKEQDKLLKLRNFIENNFEYVEENFSQKVREIYYDKKSKKAIYGSATPKEREETYDAIISTNPDIAKVFTEEGWWNSVDKDAKTLLLNKAEELYAANPELGREGALLQAADVAPTTTNQPVPETDPYAGKTVK